MFRKAAAPQVSEHAKLRTRQISELIKLNSSATCVSGQQSDSSCTYSIPLAVPPSPAGSLTLSIQLGPQFPERPPVCQIISSNPAIRLQHKYLDANGYLSLHPRLQPQQWSPHQNLGQIIQDMTRELLAQPPTAMQPNMPAFAAQQLQQPTIFSSQPRSSPPPQAYPQASSYNPVPSSYSAAPQQSPPPYSSYSQPQPPMQSIPHSPLNVAAGSPPVIPPKPSPSLSSSSAAASPPSQQPPLPIRSASLARTRPPPVPTVFPILDTLSISQLEELVNDPSALRDFSCDLEPVRQMEQVQQELFTRIRETANTNLSFKEQLEKLFAQVQEEAEKLKEAQSLYQSLLLRQQQSSQRYSLANVLQLLDAAINQAEEQSENTRAKYEALNQKISTAAASSSSAVTSPPSDDGGLLEQYIKERMLVHERAGKRERLMELYGNGRT